MRIIFLFLGKSGFLLFLKKIEETWWLKRRVVWLEAGHNNTKFFHRYANQRRISNSIWELKKSNGDLINDQRRLNVEAVNFFKDIYSQENILNLEYQSKVL